MQVTLKIKENKIGILSVGHDTVNKHCIMKIHISEVQDNEERKCIYKLK